MSEAAWFWTAAILAMLGALAAVAARAFQEFSRHFLQELCERRGQSPRFAQIVRDHEATGTAETGKPACKSVFCMCL